MLLITYEWYARDTSKKIKSTFKAKGKSGKHVASTTPYGYLKDKDDPNVWIVDEEAAVVVRRIFHMTMDGYGPYQIAKALKEDKVEIPAVHMAKKDAGLWKGRVEEIKDPQGITADLGKTVFTIRFTMTGDLTRNTVSILTMNVSVRIFTGTAIRDIPQWQTGEKRIIFLLTRLRWHTMWIITAIM